jgi:hypothetical protein
MLANAGIQNTTTLQGLPLAPLSSPLRRVPGWIAAFAGMTRETQELFRGVP